jgi:hypothetical protein
MRPSGITRDPPVEALVYPVRFRVGIVVSEGCGNQYGEGDQFGKYQVGNLQVSGSVESNERADQDGQHPDCVQFKARRPQPNPCCVHAYLFIPFSQNVVITVDKA